MPRIVECSRCGAGIGHDDVQCWRCGEPVKGGGKLKLNSLPLGSSAGAGIRDLREKKAPERPSTTPSVKPITEVQNGRAHVLEEREREVRKAAEALEAEAREVEEAAREMEKERKALKEARVQVTIQEEDLAAKAILLDGLLSKAKQGERRDDPALATGLAKVLEEERSRIRKEVERDMAEQLSHISQLEAELKAAHAVGRIREKASSVDLKELMGKVVAEANAQIGIGLPDGLDDGRVLTYVERLDQILSGGIPEGSVVLINGPPGSMKTSLTYNMLHNAAIKGGVRGMFLSLEQDASSLLRQMERLGLKRGDSLDNLMVVDLVDLRRTMEGCTGDWRTIVMRYLEDAQREHPFDLLAIDSLESFVAMSEHEFTRADIQDLFDRFRTMGLTTMVISETPISKLESGRRMELYVADGAIELCLQETPDAHVHRLLRCVKMRGANIDTRAFSMMHAGGSFILNVPMTRACAH